MGEMVGNVGHFMPRMNSCQSNRSNFIATHGKERRRSMRAFTIDVKQKDINHKRESRFTVDQISNFVLVPNITTTIVPTLCCFTTRNVESSMVNLDGMN